MGKSTSMQKPSTENDGNEYLSVTVSLQLKKGALKCKTNRNTANNNIYQAKNNYSYTQKCPK